MGVERTQLGHQIRYELRHDAALVGVLIFGQPEIDPAAWKILLPARLARRAGPQPERQPS